MERSGDPPVFPFLLGCGRSGTTLLRAMFDSHPEMAIPGESVFVATMASRHRRYGKGTGFDVDRFIADLFVQPRFLQWGLSEQAVHEALQACRAKNLADAIRTLFACYAALRGKSRYGDKTPVYVLAIRLLAPLFPEARFIHVIRDGRDVALSLRELPWGPGDLPGAALYWKRHVTRGRKAGGSLGSDRYREVRYEALLDDPEGTLRGLCGFVDLSFDSAMLRYGERAQELIAGFSSEERRIHRHVDRPPTKGLRDWRSQMSCKEVAVTEALIGGLLKELGYECSTRPRFHRRLEARIKELDEQRGRLQHRLGEVGGSFVRPWSRAGSG